MKKLNKQLFKLLRIHSPSGEEYSVIRYVLPILRDTLDNVYIDAYGNILGEKRYGESDIEVLLSAHMDTVAHYQPEPKYRNNKTEIYNASKYKSALGGDDKCGIAAILAVIREMNRSTHFTGTLKVCLSREEEIGCVGAEKATFHSPHFFLNVDAAIVLDRKGSSDIVNGMFYANFCSPEYSDFWEDMAHNLEFQASPTDGSISDTMVFSELGINGVNLSVGYYNAHMPTEYIKINELKRTVRWVLTALDHIEEYVPFPSFEYQNNYLDEFYFTDFIHDNHTIMCEYCLTEVGILDVEDYRGFNVCNFCLDNVITVGEG